MPDIFIHGAFVTVTDKFLVPLPNVISFQFNPETITHSWTVAGPVAPTVKDAPNTNPLAVKSVPSEEFSFELKLDARNLIADGGPVTTGLTLASGLYPRLAELEMLLFPTDPGGNSLLGGVSASLSSSGLSLSFGSTSANVRKVPELRVPTALFVWGAARAVPVRVTRLSVNETLYDRLLNPIQASVTIGLRVLTPDELATLCDGPAARLQKTAYDYTHALRKSLAAANAATRADTVTGLLPF